ncbi:MAG: type II toxin-antitoxin system RelE/ParE family toxin [Elusimicrobia bacterium]|nr:type II toxin-antitoxin system RelE/ParE family toxin [Elusimicrobiota bacterium]
MLSNVWFFVDERGRSPVREFLGALPVKERAKAYAYIEELRRNGYNLRRPLADYVGRGIYELRPGANRVFYFFFMRDSAVLAHAIRKRTDKLSQRDIELCVKRKKLAEESGNSQVKDLL